MQTKKVSATDDRWKQAGDERCKTCGHQGNWMTFCEPLGPPKTPPEGATKP